MYVICKRTILFVNQDDVRKAAQPGATIKVPRKHTVIANKDPQEAPDWLREQEAFRDAGKDDTIIEVVLPSRVQPIRVESPAKAEPTSADVQMGPASVEFLAKMTKAELVKHAAEVHGLELDEGLKKDEMIAAIQDAAKK